MTHERAALGSRRWAHSGSARLISKPKAEGPKPVATGQVAVEKGRFTRLNGPIAGPPAH